MDDIERLFQLAGSEHDNKNFRMYLLQRMMSF